jgi:dTDP-4-amino-4,6-dideoxygalactose transaminase/nucleoside-diphosphate-sugar epimerase
MTYVQGGHLETVGIQSVGDDRGEPPIILVGGAGFLGRSLIPQLARADSAIFVVDRDAALSPSSTQVRLDLLVDDVVLPAGDVILLVGSGNPRPRWPWTLPLEIVFTTARLLPALAGRRVTLVSTVEVYGDAAAPLDEETTPALPWSTEELEDWCGRVVNLASDACPPWRAAALCRELVERDPSGRWVYGASKLAQEMLVRQGRSSRSLRVLRLANVFGPGQHRVVSRLVRRALAGRSLVVSGSTQRSFLWAGDLGRVVLDEAAGTFNVGLPSVSIEDLAGMILDLTRSSSEIRIVAPSPTDSAGRIDTHRLGQTGIELTPLREAIEMFLADYRREAETFFRPPLRVVVPPRPAYPDVVAARQQEVLWSGALKHGNRWTNELAAGLRDALELPDDHELLLTASGTEALRLALVATVGIASPGDVAVVPSFTFPATVNVLLQLNYQLRFVDVDPSTWTLDPAAVKDAVAAGGVRVVVAVDTFGNPCDYDALRAVCEGSGAVVVADSAAGIGSRYAGVPLGTQAKAHAFSMSFAKVVSAGGAGGVLVMSPGVDRRLLDRWTHSALLTELHAVAAVDQLAILGDIVGRRQRLAAVYEEGLGDLPSVEPQSTTAGALHSYVHWVARLPGIDRPGLEKVLLARGVETKRYFGALHSTFRSKGDPLPVTDQLDREVLAFPMSSEMTVEDAELVVLAVDDSLKEVAFPT